MKLLLEAHKYAPELNTVTLLKSGVKIKLPQVTTIKEARQKLFKKQVPIKYAKLVVMVNGAYLRTYEGTFSTYQAVKKFKQSLFERHNLPTTEIKVKTYLIG